MDACPTPQAAAPCAIVIFGASGDLTKRKLLPSLYNLGAYHLLPAHFSIIGVARRPLSDDIFRDQLGKDLAELGTQPVDPNLWSKFRERISYCAGEFDNPAIYKKLAAALSESETRSDWRSPVYCGKRTAAGAGSSSRSRLDMIWIPLAS
jgi:glucose-6-phosphate 1-dehydrogenase